MTLLIAMLSTAAYVTAWLFTARARYARMRPLREPLNCDCIYPGRRHPRACYRQNSDSLIDTDLEAAVYALIQGFIWPLIGPCVLAVWAVQSGQRDTLAEVRAANKRLERELDMRP